MKTCPQCHQTYTDDNLNYCLSDGTPLTFESESITEQQTIAMHGPAVPKKGNALLWIGLTVLLILVAGGIVGGLLMYKYSKGDTQTAVNASPSPTVAAKPKVTQTQTPPPTATPVAGASPTTETAKSTPNADDPDEITPIAWNTSAAGFKGEDGQIYKFRCPEKGVAGAIWGSDIYTQDSSICTAAVHAGVITLDRGGVVTVEFRPGRSMYGSTVRNGITSNTFGEYPHSIVVR